MPESGAQFSPEDEIRELERRLEEKKRELAAQGQEMPEEKAVFREVLKERVENVTQAAAPPVVSPSATLPPAPQVSAQAKQAADELRIKAHKEQIDLLLEIAFGKGLVDAVEIAQQLHNPHLLDAFHDTLVDAYYEKLVALRQIRTH